MTKQPAKKAIAARPSRFSGLAKRLLAPKTKTPSRQAAEKKAARKSG